MKPYLIESPAGKVSAHEHLTPKQVVALRRAGYKVLPA